MIFKNNSNTLFYLRKSMCACVQAKIREQLLEVGSQTPTIWDSEIKLKSLDKKFYVLSHLINPRSIFIYVTQKKTRNP